MLHSILLYSAITLSLVACGGSDNNSSDENSSTPDAPSTPSSAPSTPETPSNNTLSEAEALNNFKTIVNSVGLTDQ